MVSQSATTPRGTVHVTTTVAGCVPSVTVIVHVPGAMPRTTPAEDTVAMLGLPLDHVSAVPATVSPEVVSARAWIAATPSAASVIVAASVTICVTACDGA